MEQQPVQTQGTNNKSKIVVAFVIIIAAIIAGVFLFGNNNQDSDEPAVSQTQAEQSQDDSVTNNSNQSASEVTAPLTANEVSKHNTADNCWTIIDGNVYDVTNFIVRHPGGSEILRACGTDATTLFTSRTTEDGQAVGTGTPHSQSARLQLQQLLLGPLEQ